MFKTRFKATIYFKSGNSFSGWFTELSGDLNQFKLANLNWQTYKKHIIYLRLDEIECIVQLKSKRWWQFWKV